MFNSFQAVKEELVVLVDQEEEVVDSLVDLEALVEVANPFQEAQVVAVKKKEELAILKEEEVSWMVKLAFPIAGVVASHSLLGNLAFDHS